MSEQDGPEGDLGLFSRINYSKIYTVENYCRVLNIGTVHPNSMNSLTSNALVKPRTAEKPTELPRASSKRGQRGGSSSSHGSSSKKEQRGEGSSSHKEHRTEGSSSQKDRRGDKSNEKKERDRDRDRDGGRTRR